MSELTQEPTIPPVLRRPLAALWISLGLHGAVIALVQVAPPGASGPGAPVIEARLVPAHAAAPIESDAPTPTVPALAPAPPAVDAVPVTPTPPLPAPVAQPTVAQPVSAPASASAPPGAEPASRNPSPATVTSAVDLTYYNARELDVQPRALREIVPDYPEEADRQRLSGKVRLRLRLEADGRVSDVDVVSATPAEQFEDSAVAAFRDARFAPAQKAGRPVRAEVLIEVMYDWAGRR